VKTSAFPRANPCLSRRSGDGAPQYTQLERSVDDTQAMTPACDTCGTLSEWRIMK